MTHRSTMVWAATLALSGVAHAAVLPTATASADMGLTFILEDLDPTDGIAPSIKFSNRRSTEITGEVVLESYLPGWRDKRLVDTHSILMPVLTDLSAEGRHASLGGVAGEVQRDESSALGAFSLQVDGRASPTADVGGRQVRFDVLANGNVGYTTGQYNYGFTLSPKTKVTFLADVDLRAALTGEHVAPTSLLPDGDYAAAAFVLKVGQTPFTFNEPYPYSSVNGDPPAIDSFPATGSVRVAAYGDDAGADSASLSRRYEASFSNVGGSVASADLVAAVRVWGSAAVVPEPESLALLLAGMGGLLVAGKARRHAAA